MDDEALLLDPTTTNSSDHNNSRNVTADEDVIVGIVGIGSPPSDGRPSEVSRRSSKAPPATEISTTGMASVAARDAGTDEYQSGEGAVHKKDPSGGFFSAFGVGTKSGTSNDPIGFSVPGLKYDALDCSSDSFSLNCPTTPGRNESSLLTPVNDSMIDGESVSDEKILSNLNGGFHSESDSDEFHDAHDEGDYSDDEANNEPPYSEL